MWDSSFVIWLIHNSKLECNKTPRFTCKETWLKCRIYSLPKCRFAFLTCQWQPLRKPSRTCKLKQPFLLPEFSSSWLSSFNKITRWLPNSTSVPQILPCCGESFKNMHCRTIPPWCVCFSLVCSGRRNNPSSQRANEWLLTRKKNIPGQGKGVASPSWYPVSAK